jgi:hypothetical protein
MTVAQERARRARRRSRIGELAFAVCALTMGACANVQLHELQPQEIETTLYLIGDAGEPDPRDPGAPLDSVTVQAALDPARSIILYLGDNVYPGGIPQEGQAQWSDAIRRLDAQIAAVPEGARGVFIPGNHDWGDEGPFGLYSIRLQESLIKARARGRDVRLLPGNGCPGPVAVDEGRLRLILLDTQWWLHEYIVRDSASQCDGTMGEVTAELRGLMAPDRAGRVTMVVGHHPLMTGGVHGGYCGIAGPLYRLRGRAQDIMSATNRRMRDSLEAAFAEHPPLIYAGGHEHNLQVLRGATAEYLLISGAGSYGKADCAVRLRESFFVTQRRSGFMRIDVLRGQGVLLRVFQYDSRGRGGLAYSRWLERRPE